MAFGKGFRPVLAPGAALGADGGGARSGPMTERSEVTRSSRQRLAFETVISARGLRISHGDFEAVREIDLEVSREEFDTQSGRAPVYNIASCEVHRVAGVRGATRSARRRRSGV
jgi:hypothetical protein